jgi:hypothetical protein
MVARIQYSRQDVAQLRLIPDQSQQRSTASALHADAEEIFGSRVEIDNQQIVVEKYDARAQAIEDSCGIVVQAAAIVMTGSRAVFQRPGIPRISRPVSSSTSAWML